jgi:methyl-accepting chemotaxis protein
MKFSLKTPAAAAGSQSVVKRIMRNTTLLAVIPLAIGALALSSFAFRSASTSLQERSEAQLVAMRSGQTDTIREYFTQLGNAMSVASSSPTVVEATKNMVINFGQLKLRAEKQMPMQREAVAKFYGEAFSAQYAKKTGRSPQQLRELLASLPDETVAAQYLYIATNKAAVGKKNELANADDGSDYSKAHASVHEQFTALYEKYGFYDFFIADPSTGNIVYTYFKEIDYGTSLTRGPYSQTALAKAFDAAVKSGKKDATWLSDYEPYYPSYEDQAAFMSVPIMENGRMVAVLITQVPIDNINKTMTFSGNWENVGLGKTGQTYLVGKDTAPRSISRRMAAEKEAYLEALKGVLPEAQIKAMTVAGSDIGLRRSDAEGVRRAVAGDTGFAEYTDQLGKTVLGSFGPVKVFNQQFGLVAEIERDEALLSVDLFLRNLMFAALGTLALVGGLAYVLAAASAKSIADPVAHLKATVQKLQGGDFDARAKLETQDEFGELGGALDKLLDDRLATMNLAQKENDSLNNSVIDIMQVVGTIATTKDLGMKVPVGEDITGAISDALNMLTDETGRVLRNVSNVSSDVATASEAVRSTSEFANAASNREQFEVGRAAIELSAAAEALTGMADRAKLANEGADRAVKAAQDALTTVESTVKGVAQSRDLIRETEKRIKRLGERSQEIGQVVTIIQAIAERTGILALNASMHAASAGEAGRSFAVVADEVKRLSESAREATSQIGRLVTAIQTETSDTVVTMNQAITQVVEINRLADEAGRQVQRNQHETEQLAGSVREIARTSIEQAQVGTALQERARIIQEASGETSKQLAAQATETAKLVLYSKALIDEVSVFKLPD